MSLSSAFLSFRRINLNSLGTQSKDSITSCGNTDGIELAFVMNRYSVDDYTTDKLQEILRPIISLISKSEKAQQKLTPGRWQHTMLGDNVRALHIASALMNKETHDTNKFTRDDLEAALHAFASMISKTDKAKTKFTPGTSQHTLQRNRLKALRAAEALIKGELDKG